MSEAHPAELPTWDLSDLYSGIDDPELTQDLADMGGRAQAFEQEYKGRIATADLTASLLMKALRDYEALVERQYRPGSYAQLLFSTDTADAE
ncbi:oligoendopeptidase F, partial [Candidatus Poribacteria bacterium]|nr:oligoendopeptidase F [Candidatus Poribacteria bacterium]